MTITLYSVLLCLTGMLSLLHCIVRISLLFMHANKLQGGTKMISFYIRDGEW